MKTITVKGVGAVSVKPDLIVLGLKITTKDYEYDSTMKVAAERIDALNKSLEAAGFEKKAAKTTDFRVDTSYRRVKDEKGDYKSVFEGYDCVHRLKVEFDFDTKRLARALSEISKCIAKPEISIDFTVKDPTAVSEELLKAAVKNAREIALILCGASGAKLGEPVTIDYNWGELHLYSETEYDGRCYMASEAGGIDDVDIEPEEIKARDTVTFVWEIA